MRSLFTDLEISSMSQSCMSDAIEDVISGEARMDAQKQVEAEARASAQGRRRKKSHRSRAKSDEEDNGKSRREPATSAKRKHKKKKKKDPPPESEKRPAKAPEYYPAQAEKRPSSKAEYYYPPQEAEKESKASAYYPSHAGMEAHHEAPPLPSQLAPTASSGTFAPAPPLRRNQRGSQPPAPIFGPGAFAVPGTNTTSWRTHDSEQTNDRHVRGRREEEQSLPDPEDATILVNAQLVTSDDLEQASTSVQASVEMANSISSTKAKQPELVKAEPLELPSGLYKTEDHEPDLCRSGYNKIIILVLCLVILGLIVGVVFGLGLADSSGGGSTIISPPGDDDDPPSPDE